MKKEASKGRSTNGKNSSAIPAPAKDKFTVELMFGEDWRSHYNTLLSD